MKTTSPISAATWACSAVLRLALFFVGWIILTQGQLTDLAFVIILLVTTTAISLWSVPPGDWRIHPLQALRFAPWFLWTALRGGADVARRVFRARMPIQPGFVTVHIEASPKQKLLLALVVSLLPGTASCEILDNELVVHSLDLGLPVETDVLDLCTRIQRVVD